MKHIAVNLARLALLLALPALLLVRNQAAAQAVRDGLSLCVSAVIPSLFPFFAAVSFAVECSFFGLLRWLRLSPGAAVFLLGLLGGYPIGARTVGEGCRSGALPPAQAAQLLLCCNNAGPAFAVCVAGEGVFHRPMLGLALYAIQAAAALAGYALFFRRRQKLHTPGQTGLPAAPALSFRPVTALVKAVQSAAIGMLYVCAFVVFFLVLTRLLAGVTGWDSPLWGLMELTAGILRLSPTRSGFALAAGLLGWGGVSVHCQSAAMLEGTGLPMGRYLAAKAVQGLLSGALAWAVSGFLF